MANNYFQFKHFIVFQEKCAMKVTTDACLFGGWAANLLSNERLNSIKKIADIGTGTGLLTLMIAQNCSAEIDAIDIDADACKEASANFNQSVWKERLKVINADIKHYLSEEADGYDFIITNPPFFDNDLKSNSDKRNLAMHSDELSLEELLIAIKRILSDTGSFVILLPYHRSIYFEELSSKFGFHLLEKNIVKQTPKHDPFRTMLLFVGEKVQAIQKEIIIKNGNDYTTDFKNLLKEYYLHL